MNIVKNDDYEEFAATYQCLEIDRLNKILKRYGIVQDALRQEICRAYFFASGSFLDTGWFNSGNKTLWPELGFAERSTDLETGMGEIETLYMADAFAFHEYVGGDIYWYFTEHTEDVSDIETGSV